jgi:two-component system, LytTR family, sensor kinase
MIRRLGRSPFPELGLFGLVAVLLFAYEYLDKVARQNPIDPLEPLIEQGTGVMLAGVLFFAVRRLARRVPISGGQWPRGVAIHVAALVVFSLLHTTLNWASREVLFRLVGLGDYDYGVMPVRYLMEFPIDVILYTCFVAGVWSVDRWRAERAGAIEAAELRSRLSQARLQNLHLQLQPHFLFNALNTVSSVMYHDPAAADTMLARLADLLRYALGTSDAQAVPLAAELDALDHYLALVSARFGDDFACTLDIEPAARAVAVPALVLQPLIENAVRHGGLSRVGRGRVHIHARRDGDRLRIDVIDDGPGHGAAARPGEGVGLAATAERLRLLYGDAQHFAASPDAAGGFRVRLEVPWRPVAFA